MSAVGKFRAFLSSYGPLVVLVPSMVAIHWAWFRLQDNELFVSRSERDRHPLYQKKEQLKKRFWDKFSSKENTAKE